MIVFLVLGFVAGLRGVLRGVKRAERDEKEGKLG
jgi:F0F1-type ATP synthase assembly protein I